MSGIREDWFPTSIWYFDLEDYQPINAKLLSLIEQERSHDSPGMSDRSSVLGWHSQDNFHRRDDFQEFIALAYQNTLEAAQFQRWNLEEFSLTIQNCWAIVNHKYSYNNVHNHPNSFLSGVYYVQTPENGGNIFFRDPREAALIYSPPIIEWTQWTYKKITYTPKAGRMLIFPSWLYHGVEPNMSDEARVCLSFNSGLTSK